MCVSHTYVEVMTTAKATFEVSSWQEETYTEPTAKTKLTRATWVQTLSGDLEGEETVGCLMYYQADGTVITESLTSFTGKVGGRTGSFVAKATGKYGDDKATSSYTVVAGSATGKLKGLTGKGKTSIGHDGKGTVTFTYDLG